MKSQYIVTISSSYKGFVEERMVFGPFNSVEDIKEWLKDRYNSFKYSIDIYPLLEPNR